MKNFKKNIESLLKDKKQKIFAIFAYCLSFKSYAFPWVVGIFGGAVVVAGASLIVQDQMHAGVPLVVPLSELSPARLPSQASSAIKYAGLPGPLSVDRRYIPQDFKNVALKKPAYQSSQFDGFGGPEIAVDGIDPWARRDTKWEQMTHTQDEVAPWWRVDLIEPHYVRWVRVVPRQDWCGQLRWAAQWDIELLSKTGEVLQAKRNPVQEAGKECQPFWLEFDNAIQMKYGVYSVRVRRAEAVSGTREKEYLSLGEVEVIGYLTAAKPLDGTLNAAGALPMTNLAKGQMTGQSGIYAGNTNSARHAVDGLILRSPLDWDARNESKTTIVAHEGKPWWEVVFETTKVVSRVVINNIDNDRLNNARVLLLGENGQVLHVHYIVGMGAQNRGKRIELLSSIRGVKKVRIENEANYLNFSEVEVYGAEDVNVAFSKGAAQDGTWGCYDSVDWALGGACQMFGPLKATDGNKSGYFQVNNRGLAHTQRGGSWWNVNLGAAHQVSMVRLWRRQDCCLEQNQAKLNVILFDKNGSQVGPAVEVVPLASGEVDPQGRRQVDVWFPDVPGVRSVTVQRVGTETDILTLAEVEVFGFKTQLRAESGEYIPYPTVQNSDFIVSVNASVDAAQKSGDSWVRYFTLYGDGSTGDAVTDEISCMQGADGVIFCGAWGDDLKGKENWAVGTWGDGINYKGQQVQIDLVVQSNSIELLVNGKSLKYGKTTFNRPLRKGTFNKARFGNNPRQPWQTLQGVFNAYGIIPINPGVRLTTERQRIPYSTAQAGDFVISTDVTVDANQRQDDWIRFFNIAGDNTDDIWCALRISGEIACGVAAHGLVGSTWAIGTWGESYFGKRVNINLLVESRAIYLYVDGVFKQKMTFDRDLRRGDFNQSAFGGSQQQRWLTLKGIYHGVNIQSVAEANKTLLNAAEIKKALISNEQELANFNAELDKVKVSNQYGLKVAAPGTFTISPSQCASQQQEPSGGRRLASRDFGVCASTVAGLLSGFSTLGVMLYAFFTQNFDLVMPGSIVGFSCVGASIGCLCWYSCKEENVGRVPGRAPVPPVVIGAPAQPVLPPVVNGAPAQTGNRAQFANYWRNWRPQTGTRAQFANYWRIWMQWEGIRPFNYMVPRSDGYSTEEGGNDFERDEAAWYPWTPVFGMEL